MHLRNVATSTKRVHYCIINLSVFIGCVFSTCKNVCNFCLIDITDYGNCIMCLSVLRL